MPRVCARAAITRAGPSRSRHAGHMRPTDRTMNRSIDARSTSTPSASRSTRCSRARCRYRGRSDGVGPTAISPVKPVPPSERSGDYPGRGLHGDPEAARQDRRGALPEPRPAWSATFGVCLLHGSSAPDRRLPCGPQNTPEPALIPRKTVRARPRDRYLASPAFEARHQPAVQPELVIALRLFGIGKSAVVNELHKAWCRRAACLPGSSIQ